MHNCRVQRSRMLKNCFTRLLNILDSELELFFTSFRSESVLHLNNLQLKIVIESAFCCRFSNIVAFCQLLFLAHNGRQNRLLILIKLRVYISFDIRYSIFGILINHSPNCYCCCCIVSLG